MTHDVKKNKLLKKILGALGFKIFPKETIKTERFIESSSINSGDLIKLLINKKKINNIIQIGANDGKSDDFLSNSISLEQCKELINIKTRQYAKRQNTWARGHMKNWNKLYSKNFSNLLKKSLKVVS